MFWNVNIFTIYVIETRELDIVLVKKEPKGSVIVDTAVQEEVRVKRRRKD